MIRPGKLILVGTPIGHPDDLSPRAAQVLGSADVIACEERGVGRRLLARLGLQRELLEINEHTERSNAELIVEDVLAGRTVALVSDCGMPVFADPGARVVRAVIEAGGAVDVVPGPDSLTAALAVSGFDANRFLFHGFLSPKKPERRAELSALRNLPMPVVFLDAPYRLQAVLEDLRAVLGSNREVCVACDLTLPTQRIVHDTLLGAVERFAALGGKREYVIIVGPAPRAQSGVGRQRSRRP